MKRRSLAFPLLIAVLNLVVFVAFSRADSSVTYASGACTGHESWSFSEEIDSETRSHFQSFLAGKEPEVRAFAKGLALRQIARQPSHKAFGEYWISRALWEAKLTHLAYRGFVSLVAQPPTEETWAIQAAAMECLAAIQEEAPGLGIPVGAAPRLYKAQSEMKRLGNNSPITKAMRPGMSRIAYFQLLTLLNEHGTNEDLARTASALNGDAPQATFGRAIYLVSQQKDAEATQQLIKLFDKVGNFNGTLSKYEDHARLLLARSYFRLGKYEAAQFHLRRVKKSSNELAHALSDLSWAFLRNDQTREAIGTAINLNSGALRNTFAPEANMVMAMALNELCRYPESIQAIGIFRQNYRPAFQWLSEWSQKKEAYKDRYYNLVLEFLKTEKGQKFSVPTRVASEWVRSPFFLGLQEQINLLYKEPPMAVKMGKTGSKEQLDMAEDLLAEVRKFKPTYKQAKMNQQAGQALPKAVLAKLDDIRTRVRDYRQMKRAAPFWRRILANHEHSVPQIKRQLVAKINSDLHKATNKMYKDLMKIAENNHFIEVEIYTGATQDIIWQNAHPHYKEVVKELKQTESRKIASQVWDWGQANADFSGSGELWEDELGSFRADLYDNCNSKDKYLALKKINMDHVQN